MTKRLIELTNRRTTEAQIVVEGLLRDAIELRRNEERFERRIKDLGGDL